MSKRRRLFQTRPVVFTFESQCKFKRRFTAAEARIMADVWGQRVYKCVHCGGRHLTSRRVI